jgi:hypothetical protein
VNLSPPSSNTPNPAPYRAKTAAAWLALIGGTLGLHRFYLFGARDRWGWLHLPPTVLGLIGVQRLRELGQDDRLAWLLIPLLGAVISLSMATAIWFALTPDERWDARHNPGHAVVATRWGPVLAAVAGLFVGSAVLMGSIAYAVQMFFEWQLHG